MKTTTAIPTISFSLTTNAFAQIAVANLSPAKMESHALSFSVEVAALTNATQFTVAVSCTKRRTSLPKTYCATLRTEAEPPILSANIVDRQAVRTRARMENEKGTVIAPASTTTNQTDSVVYSFPVPKDKLAHATFMFWIPRPAEAEVRETGFRIDLKPFTEKK